MRDVDVDVYIGFDAREMRAHVVATTSMHLHSGHTQRVQRICRLYLCKWYTRPTRGDANTLYDVISEAPMSTDHAIARFFIPYLKDYSGWALFTDGDVLFRTDVRQLFALRDPRYAVQVVQHAPMPDTGSKKRGDTQQLYPRKNWSSVVLWNCSHPSNRKLTLDVLNTWPGRDLHAFRWLEDSEIGALPPEWNYLATVSPELADPAIVHYTLGTVDTPGHEHDPFADEWRAVARAAGFHVRAEPLISPVEVP
jgi:hypothetical protein